MAEVKIAPNALVPAIRFEGFSGEWEASRLGEILDITSAARIHKDEWTDTGVPFFRTSDVVSLYKGQENKKAFISFERYKELSTKIGVVKKGDLLITGGGSVGIPYLIKNSEPLYFKDADLLWLKNISGTNGYLLFTFFSSYGFKRYIKSISHIGTISHYTIEQAKETPIHISESNKEQTKIGQYFQQLDTLIAQHQQKHDKLLNLKKSLLEKMFPKQGAGEPAIRFKGFSGAWKEKTIGELGSFYYGKSAPKWSLSVDAPTPCVRYGELYTKYGAIIDKTISKTNISPKKLRFSKGNEILVPRVGEKPEDFGKSCSYLTLKNIAIGEMISVYETDQNPLFYTYYFHTMYMQFANVVEGKNVKNLYYAELEPLSIYQTELPEQTKIGNLFQQLDTLITQHQTQLKKLTHIKQACLAKLFV